MGQARKGDWWSDRGEGRREREREKREREGIMGKRGRERETKRERERQPVMSSMGGINLTADGKITKAAAEQGNR